MTTSPALKERDDKIFFKICYFISSFYFILIHLLFYFIPHGSKSLCDLLKLRNLVALFEQPVIW